jgi:crotonobetaine/carnitine-CoA ligase
MTSTMTASIVLRLLDRTAADPSRTFLTFDDERLSFERFTGLVGQMAALLAESGVGRGDRVALMLANDPGHAALGYAVAWLGAVQVPVSVHLKRAGIELQLADVRARVLVSDVAHRPEVADAAAATGTPVIWRVSAEASDSGADRWLRFEDGAGSVVAAPDGAAPGPHLATPDREALVSYTSGTTGRPKGAVLSERYLQLGARNAARLASAGRDDVMFLWEPLYHLAGWATLHLAVDHGSQVAMVPRFSASRCWDQVREVGATKLHYLGGVLNLLLAQPPRDDDDDNPITVVWGAAAPADRWREFERRFGVELREGYGLSEAGNFVTLNIGGPVGSIGRPVEEFDAWVADPSSGERLVPGQVGELVVRPLEHGITMSRYFGDEERTAAVIRDGVVRTGDLVRMDEDGWFYFAGRVKDAVRRRGENVSAWEVERIVNEHPAVADSALVGVPSEMGEDDIKLFVRSREGTTVVLDDLFEWCVGRLAYYQVPRYFELVDELPYGPTQRVRKELLSRTTDGLEDFEPRLRARRAE